MHGTFKLQCERNLSTQSKTRNLGGLWSVLLSVDFPRKVKRCNFGGFMRVLLRVECVLRMN